MAMADFSQHSTLKPTSSFYTSFYTSTTAGARPGSRVSTTTTTSAASHALGGQVSRQLLWLIMSCPSRLRHWWPGMSWLFSSPDPVLIAAILPYIQLYIFLFLTPGPSSSQCRLMRPTNQSWAFGKVTINTTYLYLIMLSQFIILIKKINDE